MEMEDKKMKPQVLNIIIAGLYLLVVLAGCAASAPVVNIEGAWGRLSPTVAGSGAFYMLIKNSGGTPDRLLSASSPICGMTEIHETVKGDNDVMMMRKVAQPLVVPANGQVELKVGGTHVMCMELKSDPFKPGSTVEITLVFEKTGEKKVSAEIRQ
jgi:copper(I)-binding protein